MFHFWHNKRGYTRTKTFFWIVHAHNLHNPIYRNHHILGSQNIANILNFSRFKQALPLPILLVYFITMGYVIPTTTTTTRPFAKLFLMIMMILMIMTIRAMSAVYCGTALWQKRRAAAARAKTRLKCQLAFRLLAKPPELQITSQMVPALLM